MSELRPVGQVFESLFDQAWQYFREGNLEEAIDLADRMITEPRLGDLHAAGLHLILAYREDDQVAEHARRAVALYEEIVEELTPDAKHFVQPCLDIARDLLKSIEEDDGRWEEGREDEDGLDGEGQEKVDGGEDEEGEDDFKQKTGEEGMGGDLETQDDGAVDTTERDPNAFVPRIFTSGIPMSGPPHCENSDEAIDYLLGSLISDDGDEKDETAS